MPNTAEILSAYGRAWGATDENKRRELLESCWNLRGVYQDPSSDIHGREALVEHIGNQHSAFPGSRVELTSGFTEHHGKIQFNWQFVTSSGEVAIEGVDFGTLGDDGKLVQIVGFFGPPPPLPE